VLTNVIEQDVTKPKYFSSFKIMLVS
jgi:hypothetical protein